MYTLTRTTFDILRFLKNQERHPKKESYIDSNFILPIQRSYISIRQIGFHIIFSHKNEDIKINFDTRNPRKGTYLEDYRREENILFFQVEAQWWWLHRRVELVYGDRSLRRHLTI